MMNSLFEMHSIKYAISVDDCFVAPKRDDIEAVLYSNMIESMDPYVDYLKCSSQSALLDDILVYRESGNTADDLITILLNGLSIDELEACATLNPDSADYNNEREKLNAFLSELKNNGCVDEYFTFGSTDEAEKFDCTSRGLDEGSILWLLDQNFSRVGESSEAGIQLAENIINRQTHGKSSNYVYIVSEITKADSENDIEDEFDSYLSDHCSLDNRSFIYYISKRRLFSNDNDRIAKSLSQGFKRKVCYELFQIYSDCMKDSLDAANAILSKVKQKTLNYLFTQQVGGNGESYSDFAARFVQIFYDNEYNRAVAQKHNLIVEKTRFYEKLTEVVKDQVGHLNTISDIIKEYREVELYNKHINLQHSEITTGDVFEVDGNYYVLVSQSCDTFIRPEGNRKLEYATLLSIGIHTDKTHVHNHAYPLNYFPGMGKGSAVLLQSFISVPFEILDLCVFNRDGSATLELRKEEQIDDELKSFSNSYGKIYKTTYKSIKEIDDAKSIVADYKENPQNISKEDFGSAVDLLMQTNPFLTKYEKEELVLRYPFKRLFRMNELVVADISRDYGSAITRIGHPFDYLKTDS